MKIPPVDTVKQSPPFGIYQGSKITEYGSKISGIVNGYKLDIYTSGKSDKPPIFKLFYLKNQLGEWIKSKLVYYAADGSKIKTLRSSKNV